MTREMNYLIDALGSCIFTLYVVIRWHPELIWLAAGTFAVLFNLGRLVLLIRRERLVKSR